MHAPGQGKVRVPEDVSVIGIDDIAFAFLSRPPLTTICVPREQLGHVAFEALHGMLRGKRRRGINTISPQNSLFAVLPRKLQLAVEQL